MFKLITNLDHKIKSYDITVLKNFICANREMDYKLFIDYKPLDNHDFMTRYLKVTGDSVGYEDLLTILGSGKSLKELYKR